MTLNLAPEQINVVCYIRIGGHILKSGPKTQDLRPYDPAIWGPGTPGPWTKGRETLGP